MSVALSAFLVLLYVGASIAGLTLIKGAMSGGAFLLAPAFWSGFALYGAGVLLWLALLKALPLSTAFPLAAGALVVGTQLSGALFLGESVSRLHLVGVCVILVGLVVVFVASEGVR